MDIMDYFRADLNKLNALDSPNIEDLEIEAFGMCHYCQIRQTQCDLIVVSRRTGDWGHSQCFGC